MLRGRNFHGCLKCVVCRTEESQIYTRNKNWRKTLTAEPTPYNLPSIPPPPPRLIVMQCDDSYRLIILCCVLFAVINARGVMIQVSQRDDFIYSSVVRASAYGAMGRRMINPLWWTHWAISRSSQCSTTGVTKQFQVQFIALNLYNWNDLHITWYHYTS